MKKKISDPEWENLDNIEDIFPDDLIFSTKEYPKNTLIFRQGDVCDALHLLVSGEVRAEMITEKGDLLHIENIAAPRPLAPAFLFANNNRFPVDVTSLSEVEVLSIPKKEVLRLMALQPDFMQQFLAHNASRTEFLANRLQLLSIRTIKGKIAHYLLDQPMQTDGTVTITHNQSELADLFAVTRPALARSLSEMIKEGILSVEKKKYRILDLKRLKEL